jgi:hypothetical protein
MDASIPVGLLVADRFDWIRSLENGEDDDSTIDELVSFLRGPTYARLCQEPDRGHR